MKGFTDTYSPVVAFSTIRMFLIMSLMLDFKTCSIDFSNAFVQAKMKDTVYMKVPQGFKASEDGRCLKLLRSLYGSLIAPQDVEYSSIQCIQGSWIYSVYTRQMLMS
jgi:hypothetical protein